MDKLIDFCRNVIMTHGGDPATMRRLDTIVHEYDNGLVDTLNTLFNLDLSIIAHYSDLDKNPQITHDFRNLLRDLLK